MYVYSFIHVNKYICVFIRMPLLSFSGPVCVYVCMYFHTCKKQNIYVPIYAYATTISLRFRIISTMYKILHVYIYIFICMYVCIFIHTCKFVYVCLFICMPLLSFLGPVLFQESSNQSGCVAQSGHCPRLPNSPTFHQKSPAFYQRSLMFHQKSPACYQKSPIFHQKSPVEESMRLYGSIPSLFSPHTYIHTWNIYVYVFICIRVYIHT